LRSTGSDWWVTIRFDMDNGRGTPAATDKSFFTASSSTLPDDPNEGCVVAAFATGDTVRGAKKTPYGRGVPGNDELCAINPSLKHWPVERFSRF
jgi:hypothetical protein